MVACDASLQTLSWEEESSWGEAVTTMTYGVRLIEPIDPAGITQTMLTPDRVVAVRNDGTKGTPGPWSIAFNFSCWWTGRGSSSASSVTLTDLYRLLGHALGGATVAASAGTTLTGGTATVPMTTASGTFAAGGLCFIGLLGDGDGNGQAAAIGTHSTTNLNLLTAIDDAPANGAVLYAPDLAYLAPSVCSRTGLRFRLQTADGQWVVHGCAITAALVQLSPGERPRINFSVVGSWAEPINTTFPAAPASPDAFPGQIHSAGGSCFLQAVGTTTRAKVSLRSLSIDIGLGMVPVIGGSGVSNYQTITGATSTTDTVTVSAVVDANGASATPDQWDAWLTNTNEQMLVTLNTGDGNGRAIYLRNMCRAGPRPSQTALNGRNTVPLQWMAYNGTTTTSDLTRSALVMAGY